MTGVEKQQEEPKPAATQNVNEEYKIWKKNSPFLYDLLVTQAIEWPSLTFQWLPDVERPKGKHYSVHRFLCGTHTSGAEPEFLQIAEVHLPGLNAEVDARKFEEDKKEIGDYGGVESRIKIIQSIPHEQEVNRARYMPQNPDLIATKTVGGEVHVFDRTKHVSQPAEGAPSKPQIRLRGHSQEGYGVAWNPKDVGVIIDGSADTTICLWNISVTQSSHLDPERVFRGHSAFVEDVAWHPNHDSIFASVGDDKLFLVWDARSQSSDKAAHSVVGHADEINSVAFNQASDYVVATGSADKTVALWDIRNLKMKLHSLEAHNDQVLQVLWNPHDPSILASASADRRINVWDLSRIGDEQTPEEMEDGPPELLFVHGGHTEKLTDFSWNLNEELVVGSAAENNIVMIWQMAKHIYGNEEADIPASELEGEPNQ